jgi:adenine C2-methylase RlmN of 23S rRNA A2503 and tRNA A37
METKEKSKMAQNTDKSLKEETIANVREIRSVVKKAIDQGATNVEQVHKTIAKLPLKYLERIDKIEDETKDVSKVQEKTIGYVYDLIRNVNDKVSDITKELLDTIDKK